DVRRKRRQLDALFEDDFNQPLRAVARDDAGEMLTVEHNEVVAVYRVCNDLSELLCFPACGRAWRRPPDDDGEEFRGFGDLELMDHRREKIGIPPVESDKEDREPRVADPQERRLYHVAERPFEKGNLLFDSVSEGFPQKLASETFSMDHESVFLHRVARVRQL